MGPYYGGVYILRCYIGVTDLDMGRLQQRWGSATSIFRAACLLCQVWQRTHESMLYSPAVYPGRAEVGLEPLGG